MSYFAAVSLTSIACGLVCILIPDADTPAGKTMRTLASLVLLVTVLSPLAGLVQDVENVADSVRDLFAEPASAETDRSLFLSCGLSEVSDRISESVSDTFGIPADEITTALTADTSVPTEPEIISVEVRITPEYDRLSERISAYVADLAACQCKVTAERSIK